MASNHTPNTHPANFVIRGDLDVLGAFSPTDQGTGIVFIRNGGLYVEGLTDLDQTTINTTAGEFAVYGTNRVSYDITNAIEFTATGASFFKTTAAGLTLWASDTGAAGKVEVRSDGTGVDSVLINATNVTSGQVTVQSAGGSSSDPSVRVLASDTANGNVLIQGAGNMAAGNPAVLINAVNTASGQVRLTSAGASTSIDAVQILATNTVDGNILIRGSGTYGNSNPAVKIHADSAVSGQILLESAGDSNLSNSVEIKATGATNGNVSVLADGAINPAIRLATSSAAGGQILLTSASNVSTAESISINATGTAEGNILIRGAGSFASSIPAVKVSAPNASSGQIELSSAGNSTTSDAIFVSASGAVGGNIRLLAAGDADASTEPSISLVSSNTTAGSVNIEAAGNSATGDAIKLNASGATGGNVSITAAGPVTGAVAGVSIAATNTASGKIEVLSSGDSTTEDAVNISALGTTGGNVIILGKGNFGTSVPAVSILADNTTSGQVSVRSLGDSAIVDAISIVAPGTTGGNVLVEAAGSGTAVSVSATNAAGKILINSAGTGVDTIDIEAPVGGVSVVALKEVNIQSADVTNGIKIATATNGVPVVIGTGTSLTTVAGDLLVNGTTTSLSTETLVVKDNIVILNSGNGELGIDSGVVARRFQTPNGAADGDVIIPAPAYQETHKFVAGSAAPGTLNFDLYCSSVTDFYKGWWVYITTGSAVGVVRRIKSYNGTTKVATLYVTADNTPEPNLFVDGLDLSLLPAAGDSLVLMSSPYVGNFYSEANDEWTFATLAQTPDTIGVAGVSTASVQQYQNVKSGSINVKGKTYKNCEVTIDTATFITINKVAHGLVVGEKLRITDSFGITPVLAPGLYSISATGFTVDKFNISFPTVSAVTTSATVTIYTLEDSVVYTNFVLPSDPEIAGITIPGVSAVEDIIIGKTSTALFNVVNTLTYGSYIILVSDLNNTNGASATFVASSSGSGGSVSRLTNSRGADGQRIGGTWTSGNKFQISHQPAGSGAGTYTYRVRISSAL